MDKYCFIGLDIGRYENYAFVMDNNRKKIDEFSFIQTHIGYEKFITKVHCLEEQGFTAIVASEGHSGNMAPLDEYLLYEDIIVKPLHPTAVNRHKDILGQPKKTDAYDAYVIADLLFFQYEQIPNIQREEYISEAKSLSRAYKTLTKTITRLSNQLQQDIMSYFPELLNEKIFSTIRCKTALYLLIEYPTPTDLASLSIDELTEFLHDKSRGHLGQDTAKEILARVDSIQRTPSYIDSKALIVSTLAKQILSIHENLNLIKKQIDKVAEKSISIQRIQSVPGAGNVLSARFMGEVISFDRFDSESKLAMFVGIAPVKNDSGRRQGYHKTTHRVNKIAKDAIMQIAECNRRVCDKSKKYYQKKRKEGKSHWHAIKCLARQLVRVLFRMFRDETLYQY